MSLAVGSITEGLPPLYENVVPLSPERHGKAFFSAKTNYSVAAHSSSLPLTVDEFGAALRHYPIVFTSGPSPMPVALLGIEANVNHYVEKDGSWKGGTYVPAYLRRYPFLLMRKTKASDAFALCVDQGAEALSDGADGNLFEGDQPSELTNSIMEFCSAYERSFKKTRAFAAELAKHDLFTDGSVRLSVDGKSLNLTGFRLISEDKVRNLPDEILLGLSKNGWMGAIYAHILSVASFGALENAAQAIERMLAGESVQ